MIARTLRARALAAALALGLLAPGLARSAEGWRAEFDAVCAKTQDAMALSSDELKSLVARCDALAPEIDKLDDSRRKVYATRLSACRKLYAFVLETRESRERS